MITGWIGSLVAEFRLGTICQSTAPHLRHRMPSKAAQDSRR